MQRILACILISFSLPIVVQGEIVEVRVEGVVDEVLTTGPYGLDGSVDIGTPMTGAFAYDSEAISITPAGGPAFYPMISVTMTIGNYTFSHDPSALKPAIFEIYGNPRYVVGSDAPRFNGAITVNGTPAHFEDVVWRGGGLAVLDTYSSHTEYFQTTDLPIAETFPPFWAFDQWRKFSGGFGDYNGEGFAIRGELTNVFVVPEPATILLLGVGGLALLKRRD